MRAIGGVSGIGAPLPVNQVGGDNFIRYIGDRLILDFHEGAGTTVRDLSGNGNDGTFGAGAAAPTWERNRLSFDGGDDVNCGDIDITGAMTVMSQMETSFADASPLSKGDTAADVGWKLWVDGAKLFRIYVEQASGATSYVFGTTEVTGLSSFHATGVYSPSNFVKIYVDGIQEGRSTLNIETSQLANDLNLYIGKADDGYNSTGLISFIRINATVFSAPQVLQEYLFNKWRS